MNENEVCNTELRRAGTTDRAPNPLPRRCRRPVRASTVGIPTARRATPIYAAVRDVSCDTPPPFTRGARFGSALALAFATSPLRTCLRCGATGTSPECAAFVDGAHHFLTTRRLSTTRRPIMASDVGRGLREAACRRREGPVRAHSSREWSTAGSPPRGRPRTSFVIGPGARSAGELFTRWRVDPLADQGPHLRRAPRRERRAREPGCLDPPRKNGTGEESPLRAGRPASTRRDPSRGVALVERQRWVRLLVSPCVDAQSED